ncbi:MAG: 2-hydroxyacid dehydrogenase [candidate division KSB1 bacterium]|nr:2-hydroxyacid dehydrogenase [candidate division KSB1 bacterium]MDZ7275854.1 2-hydroxyacid dehydrogenase [candidate division KSB1 bacterium]MDZ7287604.1 2-hydroxyacid dehydrogenase [candidate division KSB1 bacterium]MDZ7306492.1 2-hydroxyacid dehydrogenase [candidate division KSB1 bacterium]MDZ7350582.1 2-hydroxyacid dehydrogenase [candidate division KSB1 bacterium]
MRVAFFSAKPYDRQFFTAANRKYGHDLQFFESRLTPETCSLAVNAPAVCAFVNDQLDAAVLPVLAGQGVQLLALRSAGFNHVDLNLAQQLGLVVARVPAYSPHAVAEHTVALMLVLNRKIHRAYARVREGNFALEGLLGFDLHNRTIGIIGTGRIGATVARIMAGFGCRLLAHDPLTNPACLALGARYVDLPELLGASDVVTLHCPLMPATRHLINAQSLQHFKPGAMLINTSRGALIDTRAVIQALKRGTIGALGLDVYEEEADMFFEDLSNQVIQDDVFARLLTFPNVIITGHQAFFTREALANIADTTLANLSEFEKTGQCRHAVTPSLVRK